MLQIITVFASRLEITELLWKLNILALVFSGIFSSGIKTHVDPVVKKCQVNPWSLRFVFLVVMTAWKTTFVVNHERRAIDVNFVFDTNISELCISACFACVCVLFFFSFFWIRKNQNKLTNSTAVHNITACLSPVSTDNSWESALLVC